MAQFTTAERVNAAFKQVFRILGSSNTDDAMGKRWYEELYTSIGTILPRHYWADAAEITFCSTLLQARALAAAKPMIVEDRSQPVTIITLTKDMTSNGRLWIARTVPGDENSGIIGDWVQPNDFPDAAGQPSNGFSCVLYDGTGAVITATEGAWVPYYPLGAIILGNGQAVGQGELAAYVEPLKVGVFRYIGQRGPVASSQSVGSFIRNDYLPVLVDGQTLFDLPWSPAANSLEIYVNGKLCTEGVDYSLSGRSLTWLDPFNPDLGINMTLLTTDRIRAWYVNGGIRLGSTMSDYMIPSFDGQTAFSLTTKSLTSRHTQVYLNGQFVEEGLHYNLAADLVSFTWLDPVLPLAPLGLTLKTTDVLTCFYIETADLGEGTVKRGLIPITVDGQTVFAQPACDDMRTFKLFLNGQLCTRGPAADWNWMLPGLQWNDPINWSTGLPITLKTTDELYYIADNVGARCCGAQRFTELEDVPGSYAGHAGDVPTVSLAEDALEFVPPIVYAKYFLDLNDTPADYLGHAGELVRVNAGEVALEFVPAVNFKVRALIDPTPGGGDYLSIGDALLDGVDKMELKPGKTFAESVVINRNDVDILGYPNSIVTPPPGQAQAFLLDGTAGMLERLRFAGFKVQMNGTHPNNFSAFRSRTGDHRNLKFKDLLLVGYHYHPVMAIDVSCGIDFANVLAPIEDVEVSGVTFQDWEYSCFTMWGAGIRDVRVHACRLLDYHTFGMDWYNGCSEIMINNNNFRTSYMATPVIIVDGQTKGLFINGNANHITFNNNTFIGGGVGGGRAVMISPHAGTPYSVVVSSNVMRAFLCAIWAGGDRHIITGNENSEVWAGGENADGWQDAGNTNLIIANNHANV